MPPSVLDPESEPIYYRTDGRYQGRAPYFFDGIESLPWARRLAADWRAIREEYEENARRGDDRVVPVYNPAGPPIPGWSSVNFQTYLWRFRRARRAYPRTIARLDAVPGLLSAFINVLEPHSAIAAHCGDSNAIVRCHLGLDVPSGDCAVRVGPEARSCSNGSILAFCDAHEHASWNATDQRRVVLVFDVALPRYERQGWWICANVIAAMAVVWLESRVNAWRRPDALELHQAGRTVPFPQAVRTALRRVIGLGVALWLPFQRRWG